MLLFIADEYLYYESNVRKGISELRDHLPVMVDPVTMVNDVEIVNGAVHYKYILVYEKRANINVGDFSSRMLRILLRSTCSNRNIRTILKSYDVIYNYRDKQDKYITEIRINKNDCE